MEHEGDSYTNCNWKTWKEEGTGNQMNQDYQDRNIDEIG